jgi:hypothetical protein
MSSTPKGFLLVALAALLYSSDVVAQSVRPVHFTAEVQDLSKSSSPLRQYEWSPGFTLPTTLSGWTCKMSAPQLAGGDTPRPYQVADVTCSSVAGSVTVVAMCVLTASNESSTDDVVLSDSTGHRNRIVANCRN